MFVAELFHDYQHNQNRLVFFTLLFLCFLKMEDLDLPEIKRRKIQEKKAEDKKEFKDLFQSDSESDDDDAGLKIKSKLTLRCTFLSN